MAKKGLQKKTRVANKILTVVFSLVSLLYLYPRLMNHAHMDVHSKIRNTDSTVMTTLHTMEPQKLVRAMPSS